MSETPLPVIPPTGDDRTLLVAFLDYHRAIVRRKAEGLTDEQLRVTLPGHASPLSVGNILKHLAWVEAKWARHVFLGLPYSDIGEPWASQRGTDPDWEWDVTDDSAQDILGWYDEAIRLAHDAYDAPDLDTPAESTPRDPQDGPPPEDDGTRLTLRWILIHLLEEYARHIGHLDLLREHLDGSTGN